MSQKQRLSLPLQKWPLADQQAWQAAIHKGDLFDEQGNAAEWAETTKAAARYDYGRWLMFLSTTEPDALSEPLSIRLTVDRLNDYVVHLRKTVGSVGVHSYVRHLKDALRAMAPEIKPMHLSKMVTTLERQCISRNKRVKIVRATRLQALGLSLMDNASNASSLTSEQLLAYRDGLMIALLASRPIRRRTFQAIELNTNLQKIGERWLLIFDEELTKSGRWSEIEIPDFLTVYVDRYLNQIRPCFYKASQHQGMWAGQKGQPLTGQAIYQTIRERTEQAFGHHINPHLFRDCVATTIAITTPGKIGLARDLLEHASLETTVKHYTQARSIEASRIYAAVIATARQQRPA